MGKGGRMGEQELLLEAPLHGDILGEILTRVPLIQLLPASRVSKSWRQSVASTLLHPSRVKPWLIVHVQSRRNPLVTITRAYDPGSNIWIEITGVGSPLSSSLRSSHSNFLYTLSPSKFTFSFDALHDKWYETVGPRVWRSDPIVSMIGSNVIVAGGVCDFEDDPLAVEIYDINSGHWEMCESMPDMFKESSSSTWLSVAVADAKMFLMEKCSGRICSFDPKTKIWKQPTTVRPDPSIFLFLMGSLSRDRLILTGFIGEPESVQGLKIYEVNCDPLDCKEIGEMPSWMLKKLQNDDSQLCLINITASENIVYVYNPADLREIVYCDFANGESKWGSVTGSGIDGSNWMNRSTFTCSKMSITDLQKSFGSGDRKFTVK
ncbi:hypothetical protein GIB67_025791 [Kingdonia uniflora]|uniref:F-box domain-containing protein n=1 Tax=Kingdonia uniflora TaxID=39325 RepID=A0A7J7NSZ5_9MAGN|nr:hypothetical protein GIB67_025791 [Kingdonia uniflora]